AEYCDGNDRAGRHVFRDGRLFLEGSSDCRYRRTQHGVAICIDLYAVCVYTKMMVSNKPAAVQSLKRHGRGVSSLLAARSSALILCRSARPSTGRKETG